MREEKARLLHEDCIYRKRNIRQCFSRLPYHIGYYFLVLTVLATGALIGLTGWRSLSVARWHDLWNEETAPLQCRHPRVRREWRTLSRLEKHNYFDAVYCLLKQPPIIANRSLFDDFPYVHHAFGGYSHHSALFLPWHRWFINVWENSLVQHCGYAGALPYWDWTLDWQDLEASPIFDADDGFGGDGNATGELTVGYGRCLVDGVFEGVYALRYDDEYRPHCLSRGFLHGKHFDRLCGTDLHPDSVARMLASGTFEQFTFELDENAHLCIPAVLGGDWRTLTAPNDPLWYSHHAQLDRLWWMWQQAKPGRINEYGGHASNLTEAAARLSDSMNYGGWIEPIQVAQVMGTESETLCYRYE